MTASPEEIQANLDRIKNGLPDHVTLVAVSKVHPKEAIEAAYKTGHRIYGENKVQEMCDKAEQLPNDIQWHLIGHLQRNKVKYIAPFVTMIHAVDSLRLLEEINKRAAQHERVIDVLLQLHIAEESTKFGLDEAELKSLLDSDSFKNMKNIRVRGMMGMATFTDDQSQVRREFASLKKVYDHTKPHFDDTFDTLSMGMSGDYALAIEEGSTMVRIGSSIFGQRVYG